MAEDSQASSEAQELSPSRNVDSAVNGNERIILIDSNPDILKKERIIREEEDETASDGEFIKVEMEQIDVRDSSNQLNPIVEVEESSRAPNLESSNSGSNGSIIAMEEKIRELELQLEFVDRELKNSVSENALLKSEVDLANEKLKEANKHCEELEYDQRKMKDQILETEENYGLQLKSLEEALTDKEMKHKELLDVKVAFTRLSMELEGSREKMKELEEELTLSAGEVRKLEELSRHGSSQAESESKRALELEKSLELAQLLVKNMEDQMDVLQKELKELHGTIEENKHVEDTLLSTKSELSVIQEKLEHSNLQVANMERVLVSKDAVIDELSHELNLHKVSEEKMREEMLQLEKVLSVSKADLQANLLNLEEVKTKLQIQLEDREQVETALKNLETQISNLGDELSNVNGEKVTLQSTVADLNNKLAENENIRSQLDVSLKLAEEKFDEADLLLSQTLAYKEQLEEKLKSAEEFHQETRTATEIASKRNLELEDLIQASSAAEEHRTMQLKETETRLASAEKLNMELEQQLNVHKASEEKIREEMHALENLLLASKDDLQAKLANLEQSEMKLQKQLKDKEETEAVLKEQENQVLLLQEELSTLNAEKVTLQSTVADLHDKLSKNEEIRSQLEASLNVAEEKYDNADSLLSETLAYKEQLEEKLKSAEELHHETRTATETASNRNLELEDLIQASNAAEEHRRMQLKETEMRLASAEKLNMELEQQLNLNKASEEKMREEMLALEKLLSASKDDLQAKLANLEELEMNLQKQSKDKEEIEAVLRNQENQVSILQEELSNLNAEKVTFVSIVADLNDKLSKNEELRSQLEASLDLAEEKYNKVDLLLSQTLAYKGELEEKLKSAEEVHQETKTATETASKRNLELEDLIQASNAAEEHGKRQLKETEMRLASVEKHNMELEQQLNLHKASEEKMKEEMLAFEKIVSTSKIDIQAKVANLEEVEMKLQKQLKDNEEFEAVLRNQENLISVLQEELSNLNTEKVTLESTVADLKDKLSKNEEVRSQLEEKLDKADLFLSQTLAYKEELEEKLKSAEELHQETRTATETAYKRILELEDLIGASNAAEEHMKFQLKDSETRLASAEKHSVDLEQKLNLAELKCHEAEGQIEDLNEQVMKLTTLLKEVDEETTLTKRRVQDYEDKIGHFESSLSQSFSRNSQLEKELSDLVEKCTEHEGRATATHQRSLELENLVHVSHSKAEDSEKRVGELELMLEAANYQTEELENLLNNTEVKLRDAEAESKQYSSKVSELVAELEAYQTRSESLEAVLQAANVKERELTDNLNAVNDEKKKFEDLFNVSVQRLSEAENTIQLFQGDLKSLQVKLESTQAEHESSRVREKELLDKLRHAEEQMGHHGKATEELTTRNSELNTLYASLINDSDLKLQDAAASYKQKESEAKELQEKIKSLEDERAFYRNQTFEAAEEVANLKAELEENSMKLVYLESSVEELKKIVSEDNIKFEQKSSENDMLISTNSKLREDLETYHFKINELDELLNSIQAEKEATAEQLASHVNAIESITDKHSRGLELQVATESRLKETEAQLHEAVEKFTQRDIEATDLTEKLLSLENQLRNQSEQLETENEVLVSKNLSLSQELATYETKMNELQTTLTTVLAEKEDISLHLHSYREEMETLMQQLSSDKEKLQSQMSVITEENNKLKETYQKERKELEEISVLLEEKVNESKTREISLGADMENLKAELAEKSLMQTRISELEEKNLLVERTYTEEIESLKSVVVEKDAALTAKVKEQSSMLQENDVLDRQLKELQDQLDVLNRAITEQKELDSKKELERQSSLKQSLVEIETKHQHAILLEKQVEEFKQKLQEAETKYKEKDREASDLKSKLDELGHRLSQTVEMEKKIADLENKLQLANMRTAREVKDEKLEANTKDGVNVKSRDLGAGTSKLSNRKSKKRSEEEVQAPKTTSAHPTEHVALEPSGTMAFKFILGVALVSMIIGLILGKRY